MKITKAVQALLDAIDARTHLVVGRTTGEIARRFDLTDEQVEEAMGTHAAVRRAPCGLWGYLPGEDAHRIPETIIMKEGGFYSDVEAKEIAREVQDELVKRDKVVVEEVVTMPIKGKKAQKLAKRIFDAFPKEPQKAPCKVSPEQDKPFDLNRFLK